MSDGHKRAPVRAPTFLRMKEAGQKIVMTTVYDATFAALVEASEIDAVLVGDSLGMVIQGHQDTLEVTLRDIAYHCRCVSRKLSRCHLVADLPFMSFQLGPRQALKSAGYLVQKGGAQAVKLEGGKRVLPAIRGIVQAGIPVMAHLGLTPQSVHAFGGFKVQGRDEKAAQRMREEALMVQDAGAYALILEGIPAPLATEITASLEIPTIGIGAGVGCDGQVLVMQDILGLDDSFSPRFVKSYAKLSQAVRDAFSQFAQEVREEAFPTDAHSFGVAKTSAPAATQNEGPGLKPVSKGYGPDESH